MAPEYGATMGFFPIDEECVNYLRATGRSEEHCKLYENYYRAQGLWGIPQKGEVNYSQTVELDLASVVPSVAGPKRPQDRIELPKLKHEFNTAFSKPVTESGFGKSADDLAKTFPVIGHAGAAHAGGSQEPVSARASASADTNPGTELEMANNRPTPDSVDAPMPNGAGELRHGSVLIAAITSCTNTSNPSVMIAAGLMAKKAVERGLSVNPLVKKTSLAPGSRVVSDYLEKAGLQTYLDQLGFNLVGYGCTTCIGNSAARCPRPSTKPSAEVRSRRRLRAFLVIVISKRARASKHQGELLMSPPLVVAFALAGRVNIDMTHEPLGKGKKWPGRFPQG